MTDNPLKLFGQALLAGTHSIGALGAEFGPAKGEDEPRDLTGIPPEALAVMGPCKVKPTPGVAAYLASGDPLTNDAIDRMELALEKAFGIAGPLFITAQRKGREGKDLAVEYFYLDRDPRDTKTEG